MKTKLFLALLPFLLASTAFAGDDSIVISTQVITSKKEKPVSFPGAIIPVNKTTEVTVTKPFLFPTQFNPPQKTKQNGTQLVIPMTPSEFTDAKPGWKMEYHVEMDNGIVTIVGTASYTDAHLEHGVYGENSGPIYSDKSKKILLSENVGNSASTLTSTTHFQIFARPGQKYAVKVRKLDQWVTCVISCDLAAGQASN